MCDLLKSYLMGYLQDPTVQMKYTDLKCTAAYALGTYHRLTRYHPILRETEIARALAD